MSFIQSAYLAPAGFEKELEEELLRSGRNIVFARNRLFGVNGHGPVPVWAENAWFNPQLIPISSVKDGVRALKNIQRNWALYSTADHRRAALIQEGLPPVSAKPLRFGDSPPSSPLGSWTLWDRDHILAAPLCSSPFPNGEWHFIEDKNGPPNRAYLKLWEAFSRLGHAPGPGDLCLDLGSSPGGWTWVAARLGARVFSVDKAPLDARVASHPLVEYCRGSAFSLEPLWAGDADWLFCDVACFPQRLYTFAEKWAAAAPACNMLCTIKFAGETDFAALDAFLSIPGSSAMHLFVNKHEVTWIRPGHAGERDDARQ